MDIATIIRRTAIVAFAAGGLAACSEQKPDTDSAVTDEAETMTESAGMDAGHDGAMGNDAIHAAVENASRPEEDRARDADRKPGEVLTFFGIEPGMKVLEVAAGGGYYTRILSAAVGPEGVIYAQNNPAFWPRLKDTVEPLYAELGNIEAVITEYPKAPTAVAEGSLDAILLILIYHHMHYNEESGEALPAATKGFFDAAMKALKPGGILGIVEHQAAEGTTRKESNGWHRVQKSFAIADATGSGFALEDEGSMLRDEADDMKNYWREALERGKSQRLVLKFRKP